MKGSALDQPLSCDAIAIDLDGNGQFQPGPSLTEVFDLSRTLRIGDGFYDVRPARDGTKLTLKRVTPKMGTLDVGCAELSLTLISDSGTYDLSGNDGRWELPVGTYRLRGFELRTTTPDGAGSVAWRVFSSGTQGGALSQFEIRKGRTTRIPAGPPLTLAATTTARGDTISIGLDICGRAGEHYRAGPFKGDERLGAPTFRVVDRAGVELVQGTFAYG